jgi:Zn-dependent protease with chaperone function
MKINSYLLGFAGLLVFLTVTHFFVIFKYFQIFIHHGMYYCQEMAKALYLQLPGNFGKAIFGVLALAALYTLVRIFFAIIKMYSFRKILSKKKIQNNNDDLIGLFNKLGLQENIHIIDQHTPQAFCFGLRKPKIYISTGLVRMMNKNELKVILRHEKYHLDQRDSLVLILAALVESLFPFFPVISDLIRIYRTDREVEADTIAARGAVDKRSLAEVLTKLLRYEPARHSAFTAGIISEDTFEARIHSLLLFKTFYKKVSVRNIVFSLISLGVLIGLMVAPVYAIELHEEGRDVVAYCNKSDICESICRKSTILQFQSDMPRYTPAHLSFEN